ncbi:hypothetical protein BGY98DRAFT_95719 [Russula aff. rugulosa BPL654]|nr:hypothetical protein BGY98DRAFT_95719 [Russula aff. rugulosa BPL654]
MVNFHDPIVIIREIDKIDNFWSFVCGIFIWEFLITLDYEWSVIRGHRPYRWTIWVCNHFPSFCPSKFRTNATAPVNCQVTSDLQFIFAYLAFATSSMLMVLRIIAIWDRKKIIVAFATGVWGVNIAFLIQGVIRFRSSWFATNVLDGCELYLDSIRLSTIVAFAADTILLLIMLFGLHRLRRHGGSLMGLGRFLWNQGVVWFLLAVVTELTPTVLIILNLNEELNLMFHVP